MKEHLNPDGNGIAYYKECSLGDAALEALFVDDAFTPIVMGAEGMMQMRPISGKMPARCWTAASIRTIRPGYDSTRETLFGVPVASFLPLSNFTYSSKTLLTNAVFFRFEMMCKRLRTT